MSWRDAVSLAAKSVVRRFGRAVLTVAAVTLATTLLTALVTISSTAETNVLKELSKGGPLAGIKVAAAAPDPTQVDSDNARPGPPRDLDDAALARIAGLPDVESVVPVVSARMLVVSPSEPVADSVVATTRGPTSTTAHSTTRPPAPFDETIVGVDLAKASQLPITVLAGRLPSVGSLTEVAVTQGYLERLRLDRRQPEVVVGTELQMGAVRVFASLGSDRRYRGRWTRAQIVGVVAQEAAPGQLLAAIEQTRISRAWSAAGGNDGGRLELPTSPYSGLFVVARSLDRIGPVRHQITAIGYSTSAPENLIASVQRYLHVVEIVLTAIGSIALVIASLGIANALLAAVRDRRREIGVLKAIGGRDRDVRRVFLVEASFLGFVGGVAGSVVGWLVARGVAAVVNRYLTDQGLHGVHLGFSVLIFAGGVIGATLLALVAGTLPAVRAARLPAREAVDVA